MGSTSMQREKRERARVAAQRAKEARARRVRLGAAAGVAAVGALLAGLALSQSGGSDAPAAASSPAGGLLTEAPPWPAQSVGLTERVAALGFPQVGDESYHAHALLSVFRDGQQVPVPADLGYDDSGRHSSLHTHTPDGVIHLEADDPYPYTLAHVMTTWGVAFGPDRLGGDAATAGKKVHVYVNGKPAQPDVRLADGDNVVVAYGADGSFPTEPPTDALGRA